jgi:isopropylmalate/homocitrate/citramalate synthase
VLHTTVLGVGERAGNTPMEETVMGLLTMYGVDVGLDYSKLTPLANLVQKITGVDVPSNKPVVGRQLYQIESGIIASWYKNCGEENATELFPVRSQFVGQPPAEVVMGKGSGIDSVKQWLEHLGIEATDEEALKMTAAVKKYSLGTKKLLTENEFRKIAQDVIKERAAA